MAGDLRIHGDVVDVIDFPRRRRLRQDDARPLFAGSNQVPGDIAVELGDRERLAKRHPAELAVTEIFEIAKRA
jgi:hypothetical protein